MWKRSAPTDEHPDSENKRLCVWNYELMGPFPSKSRYLQASPIHREVSSTCKRSRLAIRNVAELWDTNILREEWLEVITRNVPPS